jgi:hypothetical protein
MWFLIYGRELRTIRHTIVPPTPTTFRVYCPELDGVVGKAV